MCHNFVIIYDIFYIFQRLVLSSSSVSSEPILRCSKRTRAAKGFRLLHSLHSCTCQGIFGSRICRFISFFYTFCGHVLLHTYFFRVENCWCTTEILTHNLSKNAYDYCTDISIVDIAKAILVPFYIQ